MLPKRNLAVQKGQEGQKFFEDFVTRTLKCIYHSVSQENDYGIDGYVELIDNTFVTGNRVAIQIKHGDSYFAKENKLNYLYIGDIKHLYYYMNNWQTPIYILIIDSKFERMHWVEFDIKKVMYFGQNDLTWSIEVPKNNTLNENFKESIFRYKSITENLDQIIDWNLNLNKALKNTDFKVISINEADICSKKYDLITDFIERVSFHYQILIDSANSLEIVFPDYIDDLREIYQISEVMVWLRNSIDAGLPWFYFLNTQTTNASLHLLLVAFCYENVDNIDESFHYIALSREKLPVFFEKNFENLNIFMEKHKLGIELNKKISDDISNYYKIHLRTS